GRRRADGLIARVDGRAPRFERDGLRRATVVRQPGGIKQRVRIAERGAGGAGTVGTREAACCAVINVMPAISDGYADVHAAIAPRGAVGDGAVDHRDRGDSTRNNSAPDGAPPDWIANGTIAGEGAVDRRHRGHSPRRTVPDGAPTGASTQ